MEIKIEDFINLDKKQILMFSNLFGEAFGDLFRSFSTDKEKIGKCFTKSIKKQSAKVLLINDEVKGFIAFSIGKTRAIKIDREVFQNEFGKFKGGIFSRQMAPLMEKPKDIGENECYIDYLAINESCRKKGYGKMLLEHIHAMDYKNFYIDVLEDNFDAKNLYSSLGYKIIKRQHSFIMKLGGQPALNFMKKEN